MTISLPGPSFNGFGLFGRKKSKDENLQRDQKSLRPDQIARLFDKDARIQKSAKPTVLNEKEQSQRDKLSSLRGALYSDD